MDLGLKGKVAIVTDGTSAIGAAIADGLVLEGASVVFANTDLARPDEARRLVDDTLARFGRIDIVVSNAGSEVIGTIDEVSADQIAELVQRKLLGPWELARAVAPSMRNQGSGRFVMVISDAGKIPGKAVIASAVAGAAQHAFVKSLSDDLGRSNVLVTGVSVGHIEQDSETSAVERDLYVCRSLGQQEARWAADVPLGRRGTAADVANAVLFLSSDRSSFISGSNLDVDGGDQRTIF